VRTIIGAPWYIRNANIHQDLRIPVVRTEIVQQKAKYAAHSNQLSTYKSE